MLKRAALESRLAQGKKELPRALLLYGPNEGGARYYEQRVAECLSRGEGSESVVRITSDVLSKGGKKLRDILGSKSLFGGERVVIVEVRDGGKLDAKSVFADALESMKESESFLVVRAGGLRKDSALCKLFERHGGTCAFYEERGSDIVPMLRGILREGGVRAEEALLESLGEALCRDRMAAVREMEKVVLYYGEGGEVDDAVWSLLGDWREARISEVLYAAFDGRGAASLRALEALRMAQVAGIVVVRSMLRHIDSLTRLWERSYGDSYRLREEIARMRPFVLFAYRERLAEQVRQWNGNGNGNRNGGRNNRGAREGGGQAGRLLRLWGEGLDCERKVKVVAGNLQWVLAERYVLGVAHRATRR